MMRDLIGFFLYKLDNQRLKYLTKRNTKLSNCGDGGVISGRTIVGYPHNVYLGKNSYINGGFIEAGPESKIVIGDNCLISYNVHIRTGMHNYVKRDLLIREQGSTENDVIIGNDVWIGFGAQVMPGVKIADGCVIGAGAVVTHDTEPYGVYVGVPAKMVKGRSKIESHL